MTIISDFLIHRFIPIHSIACWPPFAFDNLYGYGLIHPSSFGSFFFFFHSFFKAFGYRYLPFFVTILLATLYVHSTTPTS